MDEDALSSVQESKEIYRDRQCLFHSVTVACDIILSSCSRNEGGGPIDSQLASYETEKADK